jgi:hypothetical protein
MSRRCGKCVSYVMEDECDGYMLSRDEAMALQCLYKVGGATALRDGLEAVTGFRLWASLDRVLEWD